ncbi:hypothetical protein ACU686_40100 [Yinghuangia aomiensis]
MTKIVQIGRTALVFPAVVGPGVGAGGRRRALQGPRDGPGHPGRVAVRPTAGRGRGTGAGPRGAAGRGRTRKWELRREAECLETYHWTNRLARADEVNPLQEQMLRMLAKEPEGSRRLLDVHSRVRRPGQLLTPGFRRPARRVHSGGAGSIAEHSSGPDRRSPNGADDAAGSVAGAPEVTYNP